ncbi:MAG TPA: hypothetical protein VF125_08540 [Solirubrobacterales bacterium]
MRRPRLARAALCVLLFTALTIGLTAFALPRTFYDDFPFLTRWVNLLPPYNEHLITDVGGLYLGFAVLFGWAAWTLDRVLSRAVCCAWILSASLHLLFHAGHLDGVGAADAIAEILTLALLLVPPALTLWASSPGAEPSTAPRP